MNNTELLNQLLSITIWKRIDGYDNYEISICGQVRNVRTKRVLKPRISKSGYYRVELYNSIKQSTQNIHRLVAKAFIPNLNNDDFIDHINNVKIDNTISNLRWCTNQQNQFNASLNKTNTSGVRGVYWCKEKNKTVTTSWQCGRERIQKRRRGRETGNQKNNTSASRCMNNGHEDLLANKDGIVGIFFSSTKSNDRIILP